MMGRMINKNSKVISEILTKPVVCAIRSLKRDIERACSDTKQEGARIFLRVKEGVKDSFFVSCVQNDVLIESENDLGFVYGLYHISREILGIQDFWFWNDQKITEKFAYEFPESYTYCSKPFATEFRGWFINDEVLLHTWSLDRNKDKPWEMVFETLLRCGGNLVIPGTDKNSEYYRKLASEMGLIITHHHAEPLGAEMFARAYPNLTPSYDEHSDKFHQLWLEGIQEQKNLKVIWNLGFRGQGDCPFWENDPRYATQEARGELMSKLIKMQYDMIKQNDRNAICCTNLYGETMELYHSGLLRLPEDVIKIWADNGYGKMVTRRQGNHNPRIVSLPKEEDQGRHGIYYHVSFYDLQAANHMTMLPNSPEFVQKELYEVFHRKANQYWIINCSNVKPHTYYLDFIAHLWREGTIDIEEHRRNYVARYFGTDRVNEIAACIKNYSQYALSFGKMEDEHAGEQFSNHVPRILVSQYMRDQWKRSEDLLWLTEARDLRGQISYFEQLCRQARKNYSRYLQECEKTSNCIEEPSKTLFKDSILQQAYIHYHCYNGAYLICESLINAFSNQYQQAFYYAGMARKEYLLANEKMREREHGKWKNFYENECLTDIKQTAWVLAALMSYLRNLGDGPHYYQWQRDFLYSEEDRRVMLVMNMENHLTDQELFELMEESWGE